MTISTVLPLYIDKAGNLGRRIEQQLNNVKLMRGIEDAQAGYRAIAHCIWPNSLETPYVTRVGEHSIVGHCGDMSDRPPDYGVRRFDARRAGGQS